jgi:hypothetical protein
VEISNFAVKKFISGVLRGKVVRVTGRRRHFLSAGFSEEFVLLGFARGKKKRGALLKRYSPFSPSP